MAVANYIEYTSAYPLCTLGGKRLYSAFTKCLSYSSGGTANANQTITVPQLETIDGCVVGFNGVSSTGSAAGNRNSAMIGSGVTNLNKITVTYATGIAGDGQNVYMKTLLLGR
jgi:hypothetical protein